MVPQHGEVWSFGGAPLILFMDLGDEKLLAAFILETGVYGECGHVKGDKLPDFPAENLFWSRVYP